MTKKSHKYFSLPWAIFVLVLIHPNWNYFSSIVFLISTLLGSVAPDALEMKFIKHRTYTHLPLFWVFCFAIGASVVSHYELSAVFFVFIAGICFGAFTHWAGDLGTPMGVPIFSVKNRYSLNLWKTGHKSEFKPIFISWVFLFAFIYGKFQLF